MRMHQFVHDGEPDAQTRAVDSHSAHILNKRLEHIRQRLRRDAYSTVCDAHFDLGAYFTDRQGNLALLWCVLRGVIQQVAQDLGETVRIAIDYRRSR